MKQRKWRIAADVPPAVREGLLRLWPAMFTEVHLRTITWAYGVGEDFSFDSAPTDCIVRLRHTGADAQLHLVELGGNALRPDGRRLSLLHSVRPGVSPDAADRAAVPDEAAPSPCYIFGVQLRRFPMWRLKPALIAA